MADDVFKGALFIHLDKGIVGTFVEKHPSGENGYVIIEYVPFMKRMLGFPKKVRMKEAVQEDHIHVVTNNSIDEAGLEKTIYYVHSGETGSAVRFMEQENLTKIKKLKDRIDILNAELSTANEKAKQAVSGLASGIASARDVVRPRESNPSVTPFMRGGFDRRPNSGNEEYEDFE